MRINQREDRGRHQRGLIRNTVHYCDWFEIFIRLFDEHFARHFESHRRETWRQTSYWQADWNTDFLGDISPTHPPPPLLRDNLPRNAKFWKLDVLDVVKLFQNIMTSPIISQI